MTKIEEEMDNVKHVQDDFDRHFPSLALPAKKEKTTQQTETKEPEIAGENFIIEADQQYHNNFGVTNQFASKGHIPRPTKEYLLQEDYMKTKNFKFLPLNVQLKIKSQFDNYDLQSRSKSSNQLMRIPDPLTPALDVTENN